MQLIFEKSHSGRRGVTLGALDVPAAGLPSALLREAPAALARLSGL